MEELEDDEADADGGFHQELQQNNTQNQDIPEDSNVSEDSKSEES